MAQWNFSDHYFVDPSIGTDDASAGRGETQGDPWATLKWATDNMTAGGVVFCRRGQTESPTTAQTIQDDANVAQPAVYCSWPRPENSACSGYFSAGSITVSGVVGVGLTQEGVSARYITGPDGRQYLMVDTDEADEIYIHPAYSGTSSVGVEGFTILEDELWAYASGVVGDGDADLRATWDADADDMYKLSPANSSAYYYFNSSYGTRKYNLYWGPANTNTYLVREVYPIYASIYKNCVFDSGTDDAIPFSPHYGSYYVEGCVVRGKTSADGQNDGIYSFANPELVIRNCVVQHVGADGIYSIGGGNFQIINSHIGGYNGGYTNYGINGIYTGTVSKPAFKIINSVVAGTNADYNPQSTIGSTSYYISNKNRAQGQHEIYYPGHGTIYINSGTGADVDLRSGGGAYVLDCQFDTASSREPRRPESGIVSQFENCVAVCDHSFILSSGTWMIKYYTQCAGDSPDETKVYLEVLHWDGTERWCGEMVQYVSNDTISARSGVGDWSQYVVVSGFSVSTDTYVEAKVYNNYHDSTDIVYIDPLPEVTRLA